MRALLSVEEPHVISDDAPVLPLHTLFLPLVALEAPAYEDTRPSPEIALAVLRGGAPDLDAVPFGFLLITLSNRGRDREHAKLFARCGPLQFRVLAKATKKHNIIYQGIPP
jgi:hypothetical protein